jgi:CO dehydrogenase maturation factor
MSITIAISGKGGVGKSTIASILIRKLNDRGHRSVLAVDADSNVNLNDLLGVESGEAIGSIREEMKEKINDLPGGMTKQEYLEYRIHRNLVETNNFDLITMGRPEGPGCYCYANSLLRDVLKTLSDNYEYVVIDNEAGMEHLSRRIIREIDFLLIFSDSSVRGIKAAGKISRLLKELDTRVRHKYLVINRARGELSEPVEKKVNAEGLELFAVLPEDNTVFERDSNGKPAYDIPEESPLSRSIDNMLSGLISG